MCVPAPACKAALAQATERWPGRSTASDGICGDAAHQARKSDHNSGNAFDLTHDPSNGVDCAKLRAVAAADPRSKYVIFNDQIDNKDGRGFVPYRQNDPSRNKHTSHMHVSIKDSARGDTGSWWGGPAIALGDQGGNGEAGIGFGDTLGIVTDAAANEATKALPEPLASLARFFIMLQRPENWLRVAEFVGGAVLVIIGVALLMADSKAGKAAMSVAVPATAMRSGS